MMSSKLFLIRRCNSIDEYGAPQAPLLARAPSALDTAHNVNTGITENCVPKTKQVRYDYVWN